MHLIQNASEYCQPVGGDYFRIQIEEKYGLVLGQSFREPLIKSVRFRLRKKCRYISRSEHPCLNFMGYSIDAIFGEDRGTFNQPEIIGLNQSLLKYY